MIILDTAIWIEFLRGREPYFTEVAQLLEMGKVFGLPWIFGELLQGARDSREVRVIKNFWIDIPKAAPIRSQKAWIEAGVLSQQEKLFKRGLGLIDVAILVEAQFSGAKIWTIDKLFRRVCSEHRLLADFN